MSAVRPLQCADPRYAVAFGDRPQHPDRRFRQASPLPQVRKSERARNPQTSTAANIDKTISQPLIVAVMTDLLEPKPDDVVLEIGTGLGYQSAVLAELVTRVYSVEIIDELAEQQCSA